MKKISTKGLTNTQREHDGAIEVGITSTQASHDGLDWWVLSLKLFVTYIQLDCHHISNYFFGTCVK